MQDKNPVFTKATSFEHFFLSSPKLLTFFFNGVIQNPNENMSLGAPGWGSR